MFPHWFIAPIFAATRAVLNAWPSADAADASAADTLDRFRIPRGRSLISRPRAGRHSLRL